MRITVLGSYGPYPKAGGACSGYLLEDDDLKILIDCGNGTISRLLNLITSLDDINAIILSHLHSDHMSDAMIIRYAIAINKSKGLLKNSIPLFAPMDPQSTFEEMQYNDAYIMNQIQETDKITFGDLYISFKRMSHPVETYSIIIEKNDKKLVYSSDTKLCEAIFDAAKDADLFICEANLLDIDKDENVFHLSAREVGEIATSSNVKKVLLTHLWPGYEIDDLLEEAKSKFSGDIGFAKEMMTYEV